MSLIDKEVKIILLAEKIAWFQQCIAFVDSTLKELLAAQQPKIKTWNLTTYLGTRFFRDIVEPRNRISMSMRTVRPEQVASLINCSSLVSLDVIT